MNSVKYKGKNTFINRLKYVEQKLFCICIDVYKNYKGDLFDKINETLSTMKIRN